MFEDENTSMSVVLWVELIVGLKIRYKFSKKKTETIKTDKQAAFWLLNSDFLQYVFLMHIKWSTRIDNCIT